MSMLKLLASSAALVLRSRLIRRARRRHAEPRQADHRGRHQGLEHHHSARRHRPAARQRHRRRRAPSCSTTRAARSATARTRKGGIVQRAVGSPSLTEPGIDANKTIANFWGQPTTLFDYIRRAMPWPTPRTLSDDEVYALCAYLFAGNNTHPARRADERADLAQGEDAEPRQLHHQVPGAGSDCHPSS